MSFANFSITTKLLSGFGLLIVLLLGVGTFGLIQIRRVTTQTEEINDRWMPSVESISQMRLGIAVFRRQQYAHMTASDAAGMAKYEEKMAGALAEFVKGQKIYDPLPQTTEEAAFYSKFTADWKAYQEQVPQWLALSKAGKKAEAQTMLTSGPMEAAFYNSDKALKEISDINSDGADKAGVHSHDISGQAFLLISLAAGISTLVGIAVALLIARRISVPIAAMAGAVRQLADGDLTATVAVASKDEIGVMGSALNETIASLHQVMAEIREAADQTAASGEELSASAQNISSGAQTQASSVEEISASIQELSKSIEQVAANTGEANKIAQVTSQSAEHGSQTVGRSIEGMKAINDSSTQIAKIIGVINQIANQTNLLALNAAIEAASAGEHGLGFAVVADEVRKLAERSSTAAQEIAQLIDESGKRVNEGATLSQEVGQSLQSILDGITRTTAGMSGITTSAESQAKTAKEVSTSIEGISAITEENSASAEEMAASAEELSAQAQRLQELVSRFRLADAGAKPHAAKDEVRHEAKAPKPAGVSATARPVKRKTVTAVIDEAGSAGLGKALYHA